MTVGKSVMKREERSQYLLLQNETRLECSLSLESYASADLLKSLKSISLAFDFF